jgi:chemotaxis protein methyltransferase CheR
MTPDATALLGEREFALARRLIAEYAGIKLGPQKRYMVHNRLSRRLRARGMESFSDYLNLVLDDVSGEREAFVNALTTNLTAFFREPHHFELLRARALTHRANERRPLRVWSSACSTGEEAWSIAMTLRDAECPAEVVGSDIDTDALNFANAGMYPQERATSLKPAQLRAHWLRGVGDNHGWISVRPQLRPMVSFMQLNLQAQRWPTMEPFDAIFCRNVVIYFDRDAQRHLLTRFAAVLRPKGLLAVGHAESFPATLAAFHPCGRTAYEFTPG